MLRRFVFFATLLALPLAAADVSGSWVMEVHIGDITANPKFAFKQSGEALTGKYEGQLGSAEVKGTVKGNSIEFSFEAGGFKLTYKGAVDGATMKGKIDFDGQGEGDFQGKKI